MSGNDLISPSELSDLIKAEPVVLIDTRDPAIYAEAHIPGAVDVREVFTYLASSTPEGMAALRDTFATAFGKAGLSGAETAVIYEQSMSAGFGQSCRGYILLRYLGYPKIRVLHGGYAAWVAAGLPSTTDVPTPTPKVFPINSEGTGILVELETMKAAVKDPHIVKLDVRDVDEKLLTLRKGFLSAQRPYPGRSVDRMVPDDEAHADRSNVQIEARDTRRVCDGRHHARDSGHRVLFQRCPGL
jgi:3-mercaptopyruvate sulfurtransferase SseA